MHVRRKVRSLPFAGSYEARKSFSSRREKKSWVKSSASSRSTCQRRRTYLYTGRQYELVIASMARLRSSGSRPCAAATTEWRVSGNASPCGLGAKETLFREVLGRV